MMNQEKLEQLLNEYGYPRDAINSILYEMKELDYEEAKKRIMPYRDITAERS